MFDWIIEYRCGQWCVIQTYVSDQEDDYWEKILFQCFSQNDAIDWRSQNTPYYF